MNQCVKLTKLIKKNNYNEFKTHLAHCQADLNSNQLSKLIFQIIYNVKDKSKDYLDLVFKREVDINAFFSFKQGYEVLEGKTPLMAACLLSKFQAVNSIIQYKNIKVNLVDKNGQNCIFYAIKNELQEECYQIIRNIITKDLANSTNFSGNSVLFEALQKKSLRIVQLLLKNFADPNFKCKQTGNTALHKTLLNDTISSDKKKDIILLLLNNKADPMIQNKEQKNCFDIAKQINFEVGWLVQLYKQNEQPIEELMVCNQEINSVTKQDQNSIIQNLSLQVSSDGQQQQFSLQKLSVQILNFSRICERKYIQSWKDVQNIYNELKRIGQNLNLKIDIIGSYATGLWTQYSDIDVVFTNVQSSYIQIEQTLSKIYNYLRQQTKQLGIKQMYFNKNNIGNSFPNIKIDLIGKLNNRKIDITIFQKKNNGQKYVTFITQRLLHNELIKPVFFSLHRLLLSFDLNIPAKNGIKTYALFLMILISLDSLKSNTLGQLLVNTIYYYAYCFAYEQLPNGLSKMNIYDPLNVSNNVGGRKTDVNKLRQMFRVADYGLRLAGGKNTLEYLFSLHNIFQK